MTDGNNIGKGIAQALRTCFGYGGLTPMSTEEMIAEYAKLGVPPSSFDKGLNPDFSGDAVRERLLNRSSGLPPHERSGHATPDQPSERDEAAPRGQAALRQGNHDDGIDHT